MNTVKNLQIVRSEKSDMEKKGQINLCGIILFMIITIIGLIIILNKYL